MGPAQTSQRKTDVEIELNHSKLTSVRVINDDPKNPERRYMQALFGNEQQDYKSWKEHLLNSKPNPEYLLLPISHQFASKAMCGTTGSVKVNYENYPYLLIDEIENRLAKKKGFDETELWQLLYCLVQAKKQMRNGVSPPSAVGDIRPQNVFLNESGQIKVANLLSWPKESTNYQKFLQNEITYLAPEDLKFVETSSLDNGSNKLSEIFSIGLTVLSAANLCEYRWLYDNKTPRFKLEEFQNKVLSEWIRNEIYSDIFKATVLSFLAVDQEQRITEFEVEAWIEQYSSDILSQKDFVINSPPEKIISQVVVINSRKQGHHFQSLESTSGPIVTSNAYVPTSSYSYQSSEQKLLRGSGGGLPLEGSRRLVEEKRLPPVLSIPGTNAAESVYTPVLPPVNNGSTSYTSHILLQGAPIGNTYQPSYVYRAPDLSSSSKKQEFRHSSGNKNQTAEQGSVYSSNWVVQGAPLERSQNVFVNRVVQAEERQEKAQRSAEQNADGEKSQQDNDNSERKEEQIQN